jgi:hypothetical protein
MQVGFIKLHRQLLDWEWYSDLNVFRLFTHLLLTVNYEQRKWRGITIEPGQIVVSLQNLAESCGLTFQQTRTALDKLKSTNEITSKTTNNYTLITVVKWKNYQENNTGNNKQITNEQHAVQQTDNNNLRSKEERKKERIVGTRFTLTTPPPEWIAYCELARPDLNAKEVFAGFRDYWIAKAGKEGIKLDWLATWRNWVRNQKGVKAIYVQPPDSMESMVERVRLKMQSEGKL